MLGKRNELRQRAQLLIQAVKLVAGPAVAAGEAAVTVQGAVDSAIGGKVHDYLGAVVDLQKRQGVLVGMHMAMEPKSGGQP